MKKVILVYAVLIGAFVLLAIFGFGKEFSFLPNLGGGNTSSKTTASSTINDQTIDLLVADTDETRIKGLSGKDSLPENQGMLFVFDEKAEYSFWMKDMKFPIDIIFMNDENVVTVYENVEPASESNTSLERYTATEPANYVLELNAGEANKLNIKTGSTITIDGL